MPSKYQPPLLTEKSIDFKAIEERYGMWQWDYGHLRLKHRGLNFEISSFSLDGIHAV